MCNACCNKNNLSGHSDVIAGALITKSVELGKQLFQQFATVQL
jgi:cystathionine beta-lyase/cystathionine gamma-synthase